VVGRAHGLFNIVTGLWPLAHARSFEAVFGPKTDRWLEYTTAGLLVGIGWAQTRAASGEAWPHIRRIGVATATVLLGIDVVYVAKGRIRRTYLFDAVVEAGWLPAWASTLRRRHAPDTGDGASNGV
jgi:hypothetical protein